VIHYRSLLYPINAEKYWETGQHDSAFRANNYLSRQHERHTDLMDVLSGYQPSAAIALDEMAALCGFSGNTGMDGNQLWQSWQAGNIAAIRHHGETAALNTYLIYLNWERNRGNLSEHQHQQQCDNIRAQLQASEQPHLIEFETNWIEI